MSSPTADKLHSFGAFFRGRDDVFPHRWENPKSGKAGYSPVCRNERVRGVCGKPHVKCGNAQTKHSFRSMRILSALISQEECQGVRGISRPACIPCYPTRLVGFWSPILTRRHGGGTLARSVILPDQTESQLPSNNPARGMVWAYLSTVARLSQTECQVRTPFRCPTANAVAERWVKSARTECLDYLFVFNESTLRRAIASCVTYYNHHRPHRSIGERAPCASGRAADRPPRMQRSVIAEPVLGGSHHIYRLAS
jgi:Integrase core domain